MPGRFTSIALAILVGGSAAALLRAQTAVVAPPQPVSFAKEVEPILDRSCRSCHGDTVQLGKLDLSTRDSALRGGARGSDLVPGDAGASRLYRRIAGLERPPMPAQGDPLTAEEVDAVKRWIDAGAAWDTATTSSSVKPSATAATAALEMRVITPAERNYWAFKLPVQAPLPQIDNPRFANPIDRFLEDTRRAHRLTPGGQDEPPCIIEMPAPLWTGGAGPMSRARRRTRRRRPRRSRRSGNRRRDSTR